MSSLRTGDYKVAADVPPPIPPPDTTLVEKNPFFNSLQDAGPPHASHDLEIDMREIETDNEACDAGGKSSMDKSEEELPPPVSLGLFYGHSSASLESSISDSKPPLGWQFKIGAMGAVLGGARMPVFCYLWGQLVDGFGKEDMLDEVYSIARMRQLRIAFFTALARQEIAWFDRQDDLNALVFRFEADAAKMQAICGIKTGTALEFTTQVVAGLILSFYYSWELTLVCSLLVFAGVYFIEPLTLPHIHFLTSQVIIAWIPIVAFCGKIMADGMAAAAISDTKNFSRASSIGTEAFSLVRTVFAFNKQNHLLNRYLGPLEEGKIASVKAHTFMGFGAASMMGSLLIMYAIGLGYGSQRVNDGHITAGEVLTCFISVMISAMGLGQLGPVLGDIMLTRRKVNYIFDVIIRKSAIDSLSKIGKELDLDSPPTITFKKVDFAYPAREDEPILKNLTFTAKAGETTAIVGPSGSGKSTTIRLIQRFYDANSGGILVNGAPISELNIKWLRSQISVVSQTPVIFNLSIRDNILIGRKDATEEDVLEAAKIANCHDFISGFPDGYDTLAGDSGGKLSGGQKQRICIARAILANPKILLLDEATSALDTESELAVQMALMRVSEGRTVLTVAHRLSTIKNSDQIVVIKDGTLCESGNHNELLEIRDGIYCEMVQQQSLAGVYSLKLHGGSAKRKGNLLHTTKEELAEYRNASGQEEDATEDTESSTLKTPTVGYFEKLEAKKTIEELEKQAESPKEGLAALSFIKKSEEAMAEEAANEKSRLASLSKAYATVNEATKINEGIKDRIDNNIQPSTSSIGYFEKIEAQKKVEMLQKQPEKPKEGFAALSFIKKSESEILKETAEEEARLASLKEAQAVLVQTEDSISPPKSNETAIDIPDQKSDLHGKVEVEDSFERKEKDDKALFAWIEEKGRPDKRQRYLAYIFAIIDGGSLPCATLGLAAMLNDMIKPGGIATDVQTTWVVFFCILGLVQFTGGTLKSYFLAEAGERMTARIRSEIVELALEQPVEWYDMDGHDPSVLSLLLAKDAPLVREQIANKNVANVQMAACMVSGLLIAFMFCPYLALIGIAAAPIMLVGAIMETKAMMGSGAVGSDGLGDSEYSKSVSLSKEIVEHLQTLLMTDQIESHLDKYEKSLELPVHNSKKNTWSLGGWSALGAAGIFFNFGITFWCMAEIVEHGLCDGSVVGDNDFQRGFNAITAVIYGIFNTAQAQFIMPSDESIDAARRVWNLMTSDMKIPKGDNKSKKCEGISSGKITFREVTFAYPTRPDNKVIKDFSISVPAGGNYALVGKSGSGKSTCVSLLERFYDPEEGQKVMVDDKPIQSYDIDYLRSQIVLVNQMPDLFDVSVEDNIRFGLPDDIKVDFDDIVEAAKAANAHEFIQKFGYKEKVGIKGSRLSGGQRQRVAIARAFLRAKNAKIVLLDEATSALDSKTEAMVVEAINRLMKGKTSITIAHKLSTIMDCDQIFFMSDGKIKESGTYEELRNRAGSSFRAMATKQNIDDKGGSKGRENDTFITDNDKDNKVNVESAVSPLDKFNFSFMKNNDTPEVPTSKKIHSDVAVIVSSPCPGLSYFEKKEQEEAAAAAAAAEAAAAEKKQSGLESL
eukprot:UC4_evm1s1138